MDRAGGVAHREDKLARAGEAVNASTVVTASGLLAFTRRAVGTAAVSSLVLQSPDGLQHK